MAWSDPHEVPTDATGERLVDYLKRRLIVVPVNEIGDAITGGAVRLLRAEADAAPAAARTDTRLAAGDRIAIDDALEARLAAGNRLTPPAPESIVLATAFEDESLLVADKPAGMHVHPLGRFRDATLLNALVRHAGARPGNPWGAWRPYPAHRLDRPVSGLVAVAKRAEFRDALRTAIEAGAIRRSYLAWVDGRPREDSGTVDLPVGRDPAFDYRRAVVPVEAGGQPAVTRWRVRERGPTRTLLELALETGRTHQIRVHLAAIGHPVAGDSLYRAGAAEAARGAAAPGAGAATRIALHAFRLELPHPSTGSRLELTGSEPPDFQAFRA